MPSNKYFFDQHGKMIDEEHEAFETYQEKTKIDMPKCKHKKLKFYNRELICKECGNSWSGSANEIKQLYDLLTNR